MLNEGFHIRTDIAQPTGVTLKEDANGVNVTVDTMQALTPGESIGVTIHGWVCLVSPYLTDTHSFVLSLCHFSIFIDYSLFPLSCLSI